MLWTWLANMQRDRNMSLTKESGFVVGLLVAVEDSWLKLENMLLFCEQALLLLGHSLDCVKARQGAPQTLWNIFSSTL